MEIENTTTQQGVSVHDRLVNYLKGDESPPVEDKAKPPVEDVASTDDIDDSTAVGTDTEEREFEDAEEHDEGDGESKWMPRSIDELAEALEVTPDELRKAIKVTTKVDGQIGEATLEEIQKNFQLEQHLNRRSQQFANERKEWEERQAKAREEYANRFKEAEDTVSALEQLIAADYQNINWKELQEEDPTQFLIAQQTLQNKFAQLQQVKQQLAERRSQELDEQKKKDLEMASAISRREIERTIEAIPSWSDESVRKEELGELIEYFTKDLGVSREALDTFQDHRLFVIGRKAMLYDKLQSKVDPKKKELKAKPKFVPPGARKSASDVKAKKVAELRRKSKAGDRTATRELLKMKISRSN